MRERLKVSLERRRLAKAPEPTVLLEMYWNSLPFQQLSSDHVCSAHPGGEVVLDFWGVPACWAGTCREARSGNHIIKLCFTGASAATHTQDEAPASDHHARTPARTRSTRARTGRLSGTGRDGPTACTQLYSRTHRLAGWQASESPR